MERISYFGVAKSESKTKFRPLKLSTNRLLLVILMIQYVVTFMVVTALYLINKITKNRKIRQISTEDPMDKLIPTPLNITVEQVANYDDRPWRPFRWPYHQTMSIFRLDINHWLDMDKYYIHYLEEKKKVFHEYGKDSIDWLPESEEACLELMETVVDHMLVRYPKLFTKLDRKIIHNEITGETLDMSLPLQHHPLIYVSKLAKEDFYVVLQNPKDNLHYLVAAAVPFPGGGFSVSELLGQHLDVIHTLVPYYQEKLQKSMEKWFCKLKPNEPVERATWNISWDHNLRTMEVYKIPKYQESGEIDLPDPAEFMLRIDRQSLRRLPKSRAIIFTNHPLMYSLDEMKDEPLVPSLMHKMLFGGPKDILSYKNFPIFRDHIEEYLQSLINRQIELGLIDENTPVKTLPTYPFAHWVDTDFDYVNGWNNPSRDVNNKYNWLNS